MWQNYIIKQILDDDCFWSLVDLSPKNAFLNSLDDEGLNFFLLNVKNFWNLLVADYLNVSALAAEGSRNSLNLNSSLKFAWFDSCTFQEFFVQLCEFIEISQKKSFKIRVVFIFADSILIEEFNGLFSHLTWFE